MDHQEYHIERMNEKELELAVAWANKEGWNPGLHDASSFYQADPQGFFAGKLDGTIIAVGSAVVYDQHFAFCGFYMVDKDYRGQGYGLALTKARLAYVGQRNAGIDGVVSMLGKYQRLGYKIAHHNARYQWCGRIQAHPHPAITCACDVDLDALTLYDKRHFPAPRPAFLNAWIHQPGVQSLCYLQDHVIEGFAVIRPCVQGFKIGPLFAQTPQIADVLFQHLVSFAKGQPVYLDIPTNNPKALALVTRYGMNQVFETARMYLKGEPSIELSHVYGITTFELG